MTEELSRQSANVRADRLIVLVSALLSGRGAVHDREVEQTIRTAQFTLRKIEEAVCQTNS